VTEYAVKDIQPNPFRHMERYPINREKVAALRESLRSTGFWDNVVARVVNGKPELAYGHHRLVALKEEYGASHKVNLIVRDFDDERMLQVMARENMEEWGTSASIEQETVRAVVEAFADGKIELPPPTQGAREIRYAPSFVVSPEVIAQREHPYTIRGVATFLGWTKPNGDAQEKVSYALGALELIEQGVLSESDFEGLTTKEAQAVVVQSRRVREADEQAAALARREAEEARQRAEQAERERAAAAEREREAREARDREAAQRAATERREAEKAQKAATRQVEQRTEKAASFSERGRTKATTAGRAVSQGVRRGEGYRRAPEIAARAVPREKGPPPQIETFTRRLAGDLSRVLDADQDPRFDRLQELVKHRQYIPEFERDNLITTLRQVAIRAETFAAQLAGEAPASRPALSKGNR
jgi:ParB-like nuclease domain